MDSELEPMVRDLMFRLDIIDSKPVNVRFQINNLPILIDKDGREIRAFRIDGMN